MSTGSLSDVVAHMKKLESLDLSKCGDISGSFDELGGMSRLRDLNLKHCQNITGDLVSLAKLDLRSVRLTRCKSIKDGLAHPNLEVRVCGCIFVCVKAVVGHGWEGDGAKEGSGLELGGLSEDCDF